jgi:transketolase
MNTSAIDPRDIRRIVLEQAYSARVGHIGSALGVADILAALYGGVLNIPDPDDPERDRFVLSKGHAGLALYAALHMRGWMSRADLNTYCANASLLGVHPEHNLIGVDFTTGSLGQGLSFATGAALAARLQGSSRRVVALVSDAECNEGSTWEAVMFAAHHQLANLIAIVDLNGQQAFGYTEHVISLSPLVEKWQVFGWDAREVDGHDVPALMTAIDSFDTDHGPPHVLIAHTISGRGVSMMEGEIAWHYLPMSEAQYRAALDEIEA